MAKGKPKTKPKSSAEAKRVAGELKRELMARALVEAVLTTDEKVCERYGITTRTLINWRNRLADDPILAGIVAARQRQAGEKWAEQLSPFLVRSLKTLEECFKAVEADPLQRKNPAVIREITRSFETVAEVSLTKSMIDASFREIPEGAEAGAETPGREAEEFGDSPYEN